MLSRAGGTSAPHLPQAEQVNCGSMSDSLEIVRPPIGHERDRVAAAIVRAIDEHPAHAGGAHLGTARNAACSVFSAIRTPPPSSPYGLHALQHRGQEAPASFPLTANFSIPNGTSASSATHLFTTRKSSTACPAPSPSAMCATRPPANPSCATCSRSRRMEGGHFAVAHNGNLTNGIALRDNLVHDAAVFQSTADTEIILHLVARARPQPLRRPLSSTACAARRRVCL